MTSRTQHHTGIKPTTMPRNNNRRDEEWRKTYVVVPIEKVGTPAAGDPDAVFRTSVKCSDLFLHSPANGETRPANCQIMSVAVNIRLGASFTTQGTFAYIWSNDSDLISGNSIRNIIIKQLRATNVAGGKNRHGMFASVNRYPHDGKNHIVQDSNRGVKYRNSSAAGTTYGLTAVVGTLTCVVPAGIEPVITVEFWCKWSGTNATANEPASAPARGILYSPEQLTLKFLNAAFDELAVDFAYKSKTDPKKIKWAKALQVAFYDDPESLKANKLFVVSKVSALTYSPNFSFLFPNVLDGGTMISKPSKWTQVPISNPLIDDDEVWYAHSDNFATDLEELDMASAYTRVTSLGPNERTSSELLTAGMLGKATINVNGTSVTPLARMFRTEAAITNIATAARQSDQGDLILGLGSDLKTDFENIFEAWHQGMYTEGSAKHLKLHTIAKALIDFYENNTVAAWEYLLDVLSTPFENIAADCHTTPQKLTQCLKIAEVGACALPPRPPPINSKFAYTPLEILAPKSTGKPTDV